MLAAYRLAGLSALETHYAGVDALRQIEGGYAGRSPLTRRPSIASPSIKNISSDKRYNVGNQGGGDDHLSLSKHHTPRV
jgi:hypothetical protein